MKQKNLLTDTFLLGGDRFTLPKCIFCKHHNSGKKDAVIICKAFPHGIPDDVLWESDEKECQNGIKFEKE